MTAVAANLLVADIAIGSDDRKELLGINPLAQGRRADDVDKCDGEVPGSACGASCSTFGGAGVRGRPPERSGFGSLLMTHHVQFPQYQPRARKTASRIRLTLPSGHYPGRQFQGLNTMCPQSYSEFCVIKLCPGMAMLPSRISSEDRSTTAKRPRRQQPTACQDNRQCSVRLSREGAERAFAGTTSGRNGFDLVVEIILDRRVGRERFCGERDRLAMAGRETVDRGAGSRDRAYSVGPTRPPSWINSRSLQLAAIDSASACRWLRR